MKTDIEIQKEICEIGKRMYDRGFVAANDGNISVKAGNNEYWATPTGVSKGFMTPDMLVKIDGDGNVLEGTWKASSEIKMHLRVYKERPDVRAVVHAHPCTATGFAVAGKPIVTRAMTEVIFLLGEIPLAPYATPSTDEVPDSIAELIHNHDAVLLSNHGVLTAGTNVVDAFYKMEMVESVAKTVLIAKLLGGENELMEEQLKAIIRLRKKANLPGKNPLID